MLFVYKIIDYWNQFLMEFGGLEDCSMIESSVPPDFCINLDFF